MGLFFKNIMACVLMSALFLPFFSQTGQVPGQAHNSGPVPAVKTVMRVAQKQVAQTVSVWVSDAAATCSLPITPVASLVQGQPALNLEQVNPGCFQLQVTLASTLPKLSVTESTGNTFIVVMEQQTSFTNPAFHTGNKNIPEIPVLPVAAAMLFVVGIETRLKKIRSVFRRYMVKVGLSLSQLQVIRC